MSRLVRTNILLGGSWAHLDEMPSLTELSRPKSLVGQPLSLPWKYSLVCCVSHRQWEWQLCCNCPPTLSCRRTAPQIFPCSQREHHWRCRLDLQMVGRALGNSESNETRTVCDATGIVEGVGVCLRKRQGLSTGVQIGLKTKGVWFEPPLFSPLNSLNQTLGEHREGRGETNVNPKRFGFHFPPPF